MSEASEYSEAQHLCQSLIDAFGREGAHRAIDALLDELGVRDAAALKCNWDFWGRPKQHIPHDGPWVSWGFLAGRGFGKTVSVAEYILREVEAERVKLIGLGAQDEESCIAVQIYGESGLHTLAPPWLKPHWASSTNTLEWPNGAVAEVRTPEKPGKIRGPEWELTWLTELQSWPKATRHEAFSNYVLATRKGKARMLWDCTAKRGHPILKELLETSARDPVHHVVVRGSSRENEANLAAGYIERLEQKYKGTRKGDEELFGIMRDESENAICKQAWIDDNRRDMPEYLIRKVIGLDAAVTKRRGSDRTGIVYAASGVDAHAYILQDASGKMAPHEWADRTIDIYVRNRVDWIVAETNKGGDLIAQNIRAQAKARGLHVVIVGKDEKPSHTPGTIYVKEVYARGAKEDRAQPLSIAYENGEVHHVNGSELDDLEEILTTWEPEAGQDSPDSLDAEVHAVVSLLDLGSSKPDPRKGFEGLKEAASQLTGKGTSSADLAKLLRSLGRGDAL